jgi:hypothetical protein
MTDIIIIIARNTTYIVANYQYQTTVNLTAGSSTQCICCHM